MAKKKTIKKSAKKAKTGRPATAKSVGRPTKKKAVRKASNKPRPAPEVDASLEDTDVWVQLDVGEPGIVRVLRPGVDLSKCYQFLDALTLGAGSKALKLIDPCTNESTDEWNEEEVGTRYVWVSGPVGVFPSIECGKQEPGAIKRHASYPADRDAKSVWTRTWTKSERQRLLDAAGSQIQATIRFRETGDSPALEEGKDIEWLKPCMLNIVDVTLGHPGEE